MTQHDEARVERALEAALQEYPQGLFVPHRDCMRAAVEAVIEALSASGGEAVDWDDLRGIAPDATGDMSSEAFIRAQRDEFDASPSPPETREGVIRADEQEACAKIVDGFSELALKCDRCGDVLHTYNPSGCSGEAEYRKSEKFKTDLVLYGAYEATSYFEKYLCSPRQMTESEIIAAVAAAIRARGQ